ncbi:NUDIX hydrolase, partial [archaeon]|nr:NUDIX hydrolase [archaeon]
VDVYLINSDQKIFIIKNHPKDSVYPRYFGPARGFVKWEDLTEAVEDNGTCYFNAARRVLEQKLGLEIEPEMLNLIHKISPDKNYKKDWYGIIIAKSNLRPLPHPLYTIPSKCGFYSLNELSQLISHKSCVDTLKYIFDFKRSKGVVRRELERIIR